MRTSLLVFADHEEDGRVGAASAGEPFEQGAAGQLRSCEVAVQIVGRHAHAGGDFILGHSCQAENALHDLPYVPSRSHESFVMVHVRWP
nr:hypothetical protein A8713_036715 [Streptomyces sp. SAT1]